MQIVYNWHVTERCNYACKYCFAKWNKPEEIHHNHELVNKILKELSKKEAVSRIIGENITKVRINFAGGEPLILEKSIFDKIVEHAKKLGFETSLITNGFLLEFHPNIFKHLDMIGISIDSLDENICKNIGRCSGKNYLSKEKLSKLVHKIRLCNPKAKLKFNTVVSENNYDTNIIEQLQIFKPDRIKILRQLPFNGEKGISDNQFEHFLKNNKKFAYQNNVVIEDKNDITQSYLMIDPLGRFFQNGKVGGYSYSQPIYEIGLEKAISQIHFNKGKFMSRYKNAIKKTAKNSPCGCLDSRGKLKKCYENESEARECAEWLKEKENKTLRPYKCEESVWHLTHW